MATLPLGDDFHVYDTTLRDGEQTSGVSFTVREKLSIAKLLLDELHVDRIEIASARVSEGEAESTRLIAAWAREQGFIDRIEVLGFVDGGVSLDPPPQPASAAVRASRGAARR